MRPYRYSQRLSIMFMTFFCWAVLPGCDSSDENPNAIIIDGYDLTDASGNSFGHIGPADNDWTFNGDVPEQAWWALDKLPVNLSNTAEGTVSAKVSCFPNPAKFTQHYVFNSTDSCVFRMIIVNDFMNVLQSTVVKFKGYSTLVIDLSDRTVFPNGSGRRVYFSFSALNKPHFKKGYGDIRICNAAGTTDMVNSCF
jgi:hypothetical protein